MISLALIHARVEVDRVKEQIVSLVHEYHQFAFYLFFVIHLNMRVEDSNLPRLKASPDRRIKDQTSRALNITISIVLLTIDKVKLLFVIQTMPDGLLADLRKEVLTLAFQDEVLYLI